MKNPNDINIKKIISELSSKSKKCKNAKDFVNFAFQFNYNGFTIEPLQFRDEIYGLMKILSILKPKIILEIGTAAGGSLFLLMKVSPSNANIISIDLPGGKFGGELYPEWKQSIYKSFATSNQKITLIRSDSHSNLTLKKLKSFLGNRKIDVLLIDGDHSYDGVKKDFNMYGKLVSQTGLIVLHDINKKGSKTIGTAKFWNKIKESYQNLELIFNQKEKGFGIGFIIKPKMKINYQYLIAKELIELKQKRIEKLIDNPLSAILSLYFERSDLQDFFPEVKKGDYNRLIAWASEKLRKKEIKEKDAKSLLTKYSSWYNSYKKLQSKHTSKKLEEEILSLNSIINEKNSHNQKIEKLAGEREKYANELEHAVKKKDFHNETLKKLANERERYAKELEQAVKEKDHTVLILEKLSKSNESQINDLKKLADEREKYANELERVLGEKTNALIELERLAKERDRHSKDLERILQEKDLNYTTLEELSKSKEIQVAELSAILKQKEYDISNLIDEIKNKENNLIELRNTLLEIEKSLTFNFLRKINKKIDSAFPSGTRRGEFKKISKESVQMIQHKGFKHYISAVKTQVKKRQFYIPAPMKITQDEKRILMQVVQNNKKTRLNLKSHSKNEIMRDDILIQDEDELI